MSASMLLELFGKGHENYAVGSFDGYGVAYRPVDTPLTEQLIEQHLAGEIVLGCYQLLPDSTVRWLAWDVDSRDIPLARSYTQQIVSFLEASKIPHSVEWSGSKGYHIFLFLEQPIPAKQAKAIAEAVRRRYGLPAAGRDHVECFPKQEALTPSSPYGNLIKLPLGVHPVTGDRSRFIRPDGDWQDGPELLPADLVSLAQIELLLQTAEAANPMEQIKQLFIPLWSEGERHNLALGLSGYLAISGWPIEHTRQLIEEICAATGDTDLSNRLDCVESTYQAMEDRKPVAGASLLMNLMTPLLMTNLANIVGQGASNDTVQQVDSIRTTGKNPLFLRVRSAVRFMMNSLAEIGLAIVTPRGETFWYREEDHRILRPEGPEWDSLMLNMFGLNAKDSFTVLAQKELMTKFHEDGDLVEVHRRSSWDGNELFLHLDGTEVYILNGDTIEVAYNGDCGKMFMSMSNSPVLLNPGLPATVNAWDLLVNDLSFSETSDAPATPEQQRELLKAWVLSFFFPELMPTRPILCCLGNPGSGKTSAMRRLLWVLENPLSDVLEPIGDKPDALRVSLAAHKFMVLDNLERTRVAGLADILNRIATGSEIELRELYTTSGLHTIRPNVYMALTAVNLPFTEETLFTRLLPLEMQQISNPLPESQVQRVIRQRRADIWLSLMHMLNRVVKAIRENPSPAMISSSRLADFTSFCTQLNGTDTVDYPVLEAAIHSMLSHQEYILQQSSPIIDLLNAWIRMHPEQSSQPHTAIELTTILSPIARYTKVQWKWPGPSALDRHLDSLKETLQRDYGAIIGRGDRGERTYAFARNGSIPADK